MSLGERGDHYGAYRPFKNSIFNVKNSPRLLANFIKNHLSVRDQVTHHRQNRKQAYPHKNKVIMITAIINQNAHYL